MAGPADEFTNTAATPASVPSSAAGSARSPTITSTPGTVRRGAAFAEWTSTRTRSPRAKRRLTTLGPNVARSTAHVDQATALSILCRLCPGCARTDADLTIVGAGHDVPFDLRVCAPEGLAPSHHSSSGYGLYLPRRCAARTCKPTEVIDGVLGPRDEGPNPAARLGVASHGLIRLAQVIPGSQPDRPAGSARLTGSRQRSRGPEWRGREAGVGSLRTRRGG